MSESFKKLLRVSLLLAVIPVVGAGIFFGGPDAVHFCYRVTTQAERIEQQRLIYGGLSQAEWTVTGVAREASEAAGHELFLWFHARGLSALEGDEEQDVWSRWSELFAYWSGDDGARFFSGVEDNG